MQTQRRSFNSSNTGTNEIFMIHCKCNWLIVECCMRVWFLLPKCIVVATWQSLWNIWWMRIYIFLFCRTHMLILLLIHWSFRSKTCYMRSAALRMINIQKSAFERNMRRNTAMLFLSICRSKNGLIISHRHLQNHTFHLTS